MFDFGLNFLFHFLILSYQRIVLNGQISSWKNILAKVHQGSALCPILFLIYINDKPDGIKSICKIITHHCSQKLKTKMDLL